MIMYLFADNKLLQERTNKNNDVMLNLVNFKALLFATIFTGETMPLCDKTKSTSCDGYL